MMQTSYRDELAGFVVELPRKRSLEQDEEWCYVEVEGERHRIRFHDYDRVYQIPGLYERLFYDLLQCRSPKKVCSLLQQQLEQEGWRPEELIVLDLGAGNGMVGEQLSNMGAKQIIGTDILIEAAEAYERDRPGVYDEYIVADFVELDPTLHRRLEGHHFNCLTCVAALGFGDIPPMAFANAFNLLVDDAWVAFNIREDFLSSHDPTGFEKLIKAMMASNALDIKAQERYVHRLAVDGRPLHYWAIVGKKGADVNLEEIE